MDERSKSLVLHDEGLDDGVFLNLRLKPVTLVPLHKAEAEATDADGVGSEFPYYCCPLKVNSSCARTFKHT